MDEKKKTDFKEVVDKVRKLVSKEIIKKREKKREKERVIGRF